MGNREWLANFDDIMTAGCVWFHIVHNAWLQADMIRGYQTPNFSLAIYQIDIKFGAMWLFVQYLIQSNNKENIKDLHCRPIVRGIHWYPVDYPHKGPVMQKIFPCQGIIMTSRSYHIYCCKHMINQHDAQWRFAYLFSISLTNVDCITVSCLLGLSVIRLCSISGHSSSK